MGIFSRLFKRKKQAPELGLRKPRTTAKPKTFLYKAEAVLSMDDQSVGRFAVTVRSYSRAKAEQDLNQKLKVKITKIYRA
jgi:hypothetical protein